MEEYRSSNASTDIHVNQDSDSDSHRKHDAQNKVKLLSKSRARLYDFVMRIVEILLLAMEMILYIEISQGTLQSRFPSFSPTVCAIYYILDMYVLESKLFLFTVFKTSRFFLGGLYLKTINQFSICRSNVGF